MLAIRFGVIGERQNVLSHVDPVTGKPPTHESRKLMPAQKTFKNASATVSINSSSSPVPPNQN
jgi:hypothetical protein